MYPRDIGWCLNFRQVEVLSVGFWCWSSRANELFLIAFTVAELVSQNGLCAQTIP
jgi:hypothetical protein